jgi:DNA polymerase
VVHYRGDVPCKVLFVGEAPGPSEDVVGVPFIGPAGSVLDQIRRRALPTDIPVGFANVVGCIPLDEAGEKFKEPGDDQVEACRPRLEELIRIASPRLVVMVGKTAEGWLTPGYKHSIKVKEGTRFVAIIHPAAILRGPPAAKNLSIQRAVIQVRDAYEALDGYEPDGVMKHDYTEEIPF